MLWVPGYLESPFSAKSQLVIEAYFKLGGANIFALQWLNGGTYTDAIANAYEVSTLKISVRLQVVFQFQIKNAS